jgi:hypothetical protein
MNNNVRYQLKFSLFGREYVRMLMDDDNFYKDQNQLNVRHVISIQYQIENLLKKIQDKFELNFLFLLSGFKSR